MTRRDDNRVTLINFGRWYYDHGSSMLPVMVREDTGVRAYANQLLAQGYEVLIRNATSAEHARMVVDFDRVTDAMASGERDRFVYGLGNFERTDLDFPEYRVRAAVAEIKAQARYEPIKETP